MERNQAAHSRAHIRLNNQKEVLEFIQDLSMSEDEFSLENFDGSRRVNAKSVIGVMYTMIELNDETYLVNDTHDGEIPVTVDKYRV